MKRSGLVFLTILSSLCLSNTYKILTLSPIPGKSHSILGDGIVKHLSEAGHEITYVTAVIPKNPHPNVTIIDVSDNVKFFGTDGVLDLKLFMNSKKNNGFTFFAPMLMQIAKNTVESPNVQRLLSDKEQYFDVIIAEYMFNEAYAGFAGVFNCPLIWLSTIEPHWMILRLIDEIPNPAYNVDPMSNSAPPLNILQRVTELYLQIKGRLFQIFYVSGLENEIYETLFVPHIRNKGLPVPSFDTLRYNGSLVLSNSHVSMGMAARLPPNFISIGGYHIDTIIKPLPKDLQKIMDNAKYGVIYFSMGSNLRSKSFPNETKQDLLKLFGELKQTVLWKFEEDLPDRPSNVHILKWAPQQSILGKAIHRETIVRHAHKNCILFITHGGLLSTTETIHFGVPIIGIPAFADQFVNVERAVKKGFAKKVDLSYTMVGDLKIAIEEILSDSKYTSKVKELSRIYHDRSVLPSKELVKWVEHVVKTGGAMHLRSPAFMMPWYQKLYLDLIFVLLCIIYTIKYAIIYLCGTTIKATNSKNKID